jgi:hypothetical protein
MLAYSSALVTAVSPPTPVNCAAVAAAAAVIPTVYVAQAQEMATEYLGQAQELLASTLDKLGVKKPAGKTEL